ncbi:MAG TPA: 4-(cytidine 5'-diphospho)-2-C-methyl-D-erythritol kinase [Phnomibacter sp.]|nr:4-(cytidine 5'-diphospho)-2-C-methyl-D-erythritol kinase [Phnomibacter sp.]
MVIFPNCKINIGLNIVGKRADGFHDLETIFYPVPIHDILEVLPSTHGDQFTQTGTPIEGPGSNNLCVKALQLVRAAFPTLPAVHIHLHKAIPMGAGLGGGSSDGAHMLLLLNKKFNLAMSTQMMLDMALELGSDCPFFILNQPCFAWGRGEMMEPVELSLKGIQLVLINPGIHVNTGWAFSQIQPAAPAFSLKEITGIERKEWPAKIINDFQQPIAAQHSPIQQIVDYCYTHGASFAAMTGSGSTCFALFDAGFALPTFAPFARYWIKTLVL